MKLTGKRYYREIFLMHNGPGPWTCFECGSLVLYGELHVHHLNEDRDDNEPTNLAAAHGLCHHRYHARIRGYDWAQTPEARKNRVKGLQAAFTKKNEEDPSWRSRVSQRGWDVRSARQRAAHRAAVSAGSRTAVRRACCLVCHHETTTAVLSRQHKDGACGR